MPTQAETLVRGLQAEGVPAFRIATNLGASGWRRQLDDLRFIRTPLRGAVFLTRLLRNLPRVRVLHINTCSGIYLFLFAAPGLILGRLAGKRVILHYHSGNAQSFFQKCGPIVRSLFRLAHQIVVPSEFLQQVFAQINLPSTIVPNITDTDRFTAAPLPLAPTFIVARNLEPVYGVDTILQGFAVIRQRYPSAHLTVLGRGSEEQRLRAMARDLGIDTAVVFAGAVDNAEIPGWFAKSSVFLNASRYDNQPVSILEAFAAGLPVVSSDVGGIPCLVKNGETGLLFPADQPGALAQAACTLLETPGLAEHCTARARVFVDNYSWRRVFQQLSAVYQPDENATQSPAVRTSAAQ